MSDDYYYSGLYAEEQAEAEARLTAAQQPAEQHPDDAAVDRFAAAMKAKLKKKRQEGRGGWQSMTSEQLSALLHEHVRKGDPVDVANLAMMLHQNGQVIEPPATVVTDEMVEAVRELAAAQQQGQAAHPSAPVGVPSAKTLASVVWSDWMTNEQADRLGDALHKWLTAYFALTTALAQQPAAPSGAALGDLGMQDDTLLRDTKPNEV